MEVGMEVRERGQAVLVLGLAIALLGIILVGIVLDGSLVLRYYIMLRNACSLAAQTAAGQSLDVPYYMQFSVVKLDESRARAIATSMFNQNKLPSMRLLRVTVSPYERWVEVEGEGVVTPVIMGGQIRVRVRARAYGAYGVRREGE